VPDAQSQCQSKWISVKDRLPEQELSVLVYSPFVEDCVDKAYLYNDVWYDISQSDDIPNVTHWQPLPEPPIKD